MTTAPPAAVRSPGRWATIGLAAVLCAQFGLSLGSTIVKEIGAPGLATAAWRLVFGSAIWMVVLHRRGAPLGAGHPSGRPGAVFFAADIALFFVAVTKTSVANAEFIGSLVPVAVVPLAALLFHERCAPLSIAFGAVALAGVAVILFTAPASGTAPRPATSWPSWRWACGPATCSRPAGRAPCSAPRSS